jgi:hypothetical protein
VYWLKSLGTEGLSQAVQRRPIPSRRCEQRGRIETLRRSSYDPATDRSTTLGGVAVTGGRVFYTWTDGDPFTSPFRLYEMTDPPIREP